MTIFTLFLRFLSWDDKEFVEGVGWTGSLVNRESDGKVRQRVI